MTDKILAQKCPPGMTHTLGYYNCTRWDVQLVVSHFNVTFMLKPGKYLEDRQGRKINDPYFDRYVNKQLQRETSDEEVPILFMPVFNAASMPVRPANPVQIVTEWKQDSRGFKQPVLPGSQPALPAPAAALPANVLSVTASVSSASSVRPYTMEDARKLGLARKTRDVPEDYGATDTTGIPTANAPRMKIAIDSSMNKPAPPLPPELTEMTEGVTGLDKRAGLLSTLKKGSTLPAPEAGSENPFANAADMGQSPPAPPSAAPLQPPAPPVRQPARPPLPVRSPAKLPPRVPVARVESVPPVLLEEQPDNVADIGPSDSIADLGQPGIDLPPEEDGMTPPDLGDEPPAQAATLPEDDEQAAAEFQEAQTQPARPLRPLQPPAARPPAPPMRPLTSPTGYRCGLCDNGFKFRSQLQGHAERRHPGKVQLVMANYPMDPPTRPV